MSCYRAAPYIVRCSASGSNMVGSLIGLYNEPKNPFYYMSLYAGSAYFFSNLYEAYKEFSKPPSFVQRLEEQQIDLEMGK